MKKMKSSVIIILVSVSIASIMFLYAYFSENRNIENPPGEVITLEFEFTNLFLIPIDNGYSVWKPKAIPLLMPAKFFCWGCVGVTGAFMFFHPQTESYVIGTFNDKSYTSKALRFMLTKVIKSLLN